MSFLKYKVMLKREHFFNYYEKKSYSVHVKFSCIIFSTFFFYLITSIEVGQLKEEMSTNSIHHDDHTNQGPAPDYDSAQSLRFTT